MASIRTVRDRALRNYGHMFDSLQTESESIRNRGGRPLTYRIVAHNARIALSAWKSEAENPDPVDAPHRCRCETCVDYLSRVGTR